MCTNFPWFLATIFLTNHWWDLDPYNLFGFGPLLCLRKFYDCKILKCLFRSSDGKTGVDKLRYIKNSYNKYKPPSRILKYSALYFLWAVNHSAPPPPPSRADCGFVMVWGFLSRVRVVVERSRAWDPSTPPYPPTRALQSSFLFSFLYAIYNCTLTFPS